MASVRERVFKQITDIKFKGYEPIKIHLTPEDEAELAAAGPDVHGSVMHQKIQETGIRTAMRRYMGMKVYWDAEETKVIGEKERH